MDTVLTSLEFAARVAALLVWLAAMGALICGLILIIMFLIRAMKEGE
mgnify:FL=1